MEYRKLVEVEFREFDREALQKSWEWLNDPQLKSLTMTPDFDQESQERWFESLKTGSVTFSVSLVYCFISLITNLFLFFNFT